MLADTMYATKHSQHNTADEAHALQHAYRNLAQAVYLTAVRDAARGRSQALRDEAQDWLTSAEGILFCHISGFDHQATRRWLKAGCPYNHKQRKNPVRRAKNTQSATKPGVELLEVAA